MKRERERRETWAKETDKNFAVFGDFEIELEILVASAKKSGS